MTRVRLRTATPPALQPPAYRPTPLFPSPALPPTNPHDYLNRALRRLLLRAGLDTQGITPHTLRHTFAPISFATEWM